MNAPEPYYVAALSPEINELWGEHHVYGQPEEIRELCGYRMLTSFYDDGFTELTNRRELLYHRLAELYDTGADDILPTIRGILPTDSIIPRIVAALATPYNDPPTRRWLQEGAETEASDRLRNLFKRDGIDGRLMAALRKAKLMSGCLVGVYVGARGRMQVQILTPDLCRYNVDPQLPDKLTSLTLPLLRRTDENAEPLDEPVTVYQVWTDEEIRYEDAGGEESFFWESTPVAERADPEVPEERAVVRRPNPYGRIPFVVMRLVEPDSMATFSAGLAWAVDTMIAINGIEMNGELSVHYEAHGHWFAVNAGFSTGTPPRMGIGGMTALDGIESSSEKLPPILTNAAQNGQYPTIAEYREKRCNQLQLDAGVPPSEIAREGTMPLSGVARYIERKPLLEQRKADIQNLIFFEQEFSDLYILVYNVDVAGTTDEPALPPDLMVETTFTDEDLIIEPDKAIELAEKRFSAGSIGAARYLRETTGQVVGSDREAATIIVANKKMLEAIAAGDAAAIKSEDEAGAGATGTDAAATGEPNAGSAADELRTSVGGSAQVAERQVEFYEGKVPREAVIANLVHVLGFKQAEAEALLPEKVPVPLTTIGAGEVEATLSTGASPQPTE